MAFLSVLLLKLLVVLLTFPVVVFSAPAQENEQMAIIKTEGPKCKRREYFHNETQQCYKERTKGPCSGNLVFLKYDKIFGDCDCIEDGIVPWVYHKGTDTCYQSYQQAYCSSGEWLIFNASRKLACVQNICANNITNELHDDENPVVLLNKGNNCVQLNTPSTFCSSNQEVGIVTNDVLPQCISAIAEQSVAETKKLACRPGSRRDVNGKCQKITAIEAYDD